MKIDKLERGTPYAEFETASRRLPDKQDKVISGIISALRKADAYPDAAIYTGIDGAHVERDRTFGDRTSTWGFPENKVIYEAKTADRLGTGWDDESPLYYALDCSDVQPALVICNAALLVCRTEIDPIAMDYEYIVAPGRTMDEAVSAVLYIRD